MAKSGKFTLPRVGASLAAPPGTQAGAAEAGSRRPGPMAVAGRESAEAMTRMVEDQAEQRRRNAEEAEAWRDAQADGRLLRRLPLDAIACDDLPRDRMALHAVAQSDAMEELKASIRARGQREPIEVFADADGRWQLKTGWRRLEALRQLRAGAPEGGFDTVLVRVEGEGERVGLYVGMVEENAIREDVSFAEMANVAIAMARDPQTAVTTPDEAVSALYASLHKAKRSNIRRFVELLEAVGTVLADPRAVPKHLGSEAARLLNGDQARVERLRAALAVARDARVQNDVLAAFCEAETLADARAETGSAQSAAPSRACADARQKYEFHHAGMKVTARRGEVRIRAMEDFASMPRERLERAVAAFRAKLAE